MSHNANVTYAHRSVAVRQNWTRAFLWVSVIAWGFLVGAKLFDLRVLVGAWSAAPPESLGLLPYGTHYPVDTGDFFIPSSAGLLMATLGALIAGWRTPAHFRVWLVVSLAMILATLILTVAEFWPRNAALWAVAEGSASAPREHDAIVRMVREWVALDWVRVAMGTVGFVASIRAISVPYPTSVKEPKPATLGMKIAYAILVASILVFVVYFASRA